MSLSTFTLLADGKKETNEFTEARLRWDPLNFKADAGPGLDGFALVFA